MQNSWFIGIVRGCRTTGAGDLSLLLQCCRSVGGHISSYTLSMHLEVAFPPNVINAIDITNAMNTTNAADGTDTTTVSIVAFLPLCQLHLLRTFLAYIVCIALDGCPT